MTLMIMVQFAVFILSAAVGVFCLVLSRRLRRLNDLETGLGGAIAVLSAEMSRMQSGLNAARQEAGAAARHLSDEIERAKSERAYWTLQRGMVGAPPKRPLRRRREEGREHA